MNRARPPVKRRRRPKRSASEPAVSTTLASASVYASTTHCRPLSPVPRSSAIRDSAVLTTAMSSMSIAVATQTTARVQRFVVMAGSARPRRADQGRRLSCETPVRGTVRGGAGSTTPTCSPRAEAQARDLVGGALDHERPQAHADAVPARLEARDDLGQRAVARRDQARLPRVDGDPDPPPQGLGRGQRGAARVGAHQRRPRRPRRARPGRAGRCRPAAARRRRRRGARAARPAGRAGAAGRRR